MVGLQATDVIKYSFVELCVYKSPITLNKFIDRVLHTSIDIHKNKIIIKNTGKLKKQKHKKITGK